MGPGNPKLPPAPGPSSISTPGLGPGLPPPPAPHGSYASSSSNHIPPGEAASNALVPINSNSAPGPAAFVDDIDIHTIPPEFKKDGPDWFAVFNPKVKRVLDVNLVHTLVHERLVISVVHVTGLIMFLVSFVAFVSPRMESTSLLGVIVQLKFTIPRPELRLCKSLYATEECS